MRFYEFAGAEYQLELLKQIMKNTWRVLDTQAAHERARTRRVQQPAAIPAQKPTQATAPQATSKKRPTAKKLMLKPVKPTPPRTSKPNNLNKGLKPAKAVTNTAKGGITATTPKTLRVMPLKPRAPKKPMSPVKPLRAGEVLVSRTGLKQQTQNPSVQFFKTP